MKPPLSENKIRFKGIQKMRAQLRVSTNFLTVPRTNNEILFIIWKFDFSSRGVLGRNYTLSIKVLLLQMLTFRLQDYWAGARKSLQNDMHDQTADPRSLITLRCIIATKPQAPVSVSVDRFLITSQRSENGKTGDDIRRITKLKHSLGFLLVTVYLRRKHVIFH